MDDPIELYSMQFQLALRRAEMRLLTLRGGVDSVSLPESAALARLLTEGMKPDAAADWVHARKVR